VLAEIRADLGHLATAVAGVRRDLDAFSDLRALKAWLASYRAGRRAAAARTEFWDDVD
jgi:hypothetical protein